MNFVLDKLVKLSNFLGVNGPGPSKEGGLEISGSWLTEVLAWLADAVVKIATVIWGWLITIFYVVVRFCLNIIDILQMFAEKLVGIEVYNQNGGLSAVEKLEDTDLIIRFITNKGIIKTFGTICVLGIILLIIFSILALVKQNYNAAITDGADGAKKGPRDVLKFAGRGIFMCLLVPFLVVFGILGSNAVLASVCNAIRGDNNLTIGGIIYTASAYEANKFREYANDGLRVPIFEAQSTEVVVPSDYRDQQDMQVLFYKLAKGTIYISAISDDKWFKNNISNYQTWANEIEVEDIDKAIEKIAGSNKLNSFKNHFNQWYKHYFNAKESLAELGMFNKYINSIYSSNWTANKKYVNKTYDFSSTYKTSQKVNFNSIKYDREDEYLPNNQGLPIYGDAIVADVIVNSSTYTGHENFAPIELEYYVMADMIDFAIEQGMTLYYVNANHENIKWSDIDLDPDSEKDKIVDIKEYNSQFIVTELPSGVGGSSYGLSAYTQHSLDKYKKENPGNDLVDYAKDNVGGELIASSAFAVRYYNGLSRLYWSETGATSEQEGATFIICYKTSDGTYIPVTQETTKFKSNFLAEDYSGPVVARGIFQSEGVIPKDYCLPTAITEQVVDTNGRELIGFNKISPFAITDTYDPATEDGALDKIGEFCGRLGDLTGSALFTVLDKTMQAADNVINEWKNWLANDLVQALGEDDVATSWADYKKYFGETEDDLIAKRKDVKYKTETEFNNAKTIYGEVRTDNLLINPNIAGYTYTAYGDTKDDNGEFLPKSVMFYDENGRKISAGTGYIDANGGDLIEIPIANSAIKKDFNKTSYVVLQMSSFNDVVVPWYFADGGNLTSIIQAIASNVFAKDSCKDYTYLIAEYTYDNIQFTLTKAGGTVGPTYRMLLDFNVTGLYEIRPGDSEIGKKETSGEFIVSDKYQTIAGVNFVVEKKANLVVSNGEIFYSNGTRFFGREEAKKLYTDYFDNYIKDLFTTSLIGYIDNANASVSFAKVLAKITNPKDPGTSIFKDFDITNMSETKWKNIYDKGAGTLWVKDLKTIGDMKNAITEYLMSIFSAGEYRAGIASFITKFDETYYTTEEKLSTYVDKEDGNKVKTKLDGTIKFYNQNNQVVGSQIEYTEKNRVENNKITLNLAVVGGAKNSTNISYVTIIDEDSTRGFVPGEFAHSAIDDIIDAINKQAGTTLLPSTEDNTYASRYVWYYDATYTFSYDEYLYRTSDVDRGIVGAYGLTIDDVKVAYTKKSSNETPEPPKNLLRSRNGGIFSDILGKYILTSDGATKYIENNIAQANGVSGEIVSAKFDYIKANGEPGSGLSAGSRLLKIDAKTISVEPRSEYNNFYTYFVRGNLKWMMLFDFCIHLPTISFSPKLDFDFAFRFRLGTAYNYAESVIWRLQAGQFYLDYNFRSAVGIGQSNIYRMSAINPFLLIFSTALVTTILWTTIWGLIKRIYEVVLLFLMLPAVCATMPVDEGARFGKWTKELMDKIFAAYSVLIMLNLYFVLIPVVKDVTSDLITLGDIPNTITGMFGAISTAISSFGGWISGLGAKMTGAISSFGGKIGGLVGNIGMNNFLLELESAELTNAQQALLGHVNSIIYIMFFLVLTTLLRGGGKGILEDVLSIGKLDGEKTLGEVKATTDSVRKSPMIQLPQKAIKATAHLAGNTAKFVGGAVAGIATRSPQVAQTVWGTMDKVDVPKMADLDPSGGVPSASGEGSGENSGKSGSGTSGSAPGGASDTYNNNVGKFSGYAEKTTSRFDNHGEVEIDEIYERAAKELDGKSEQEINDYILEHGNAVKEKIYNMAQWRPAEGILPEDMPRMTYEEYLDAVKNAKDDQTREKLEQVRYAYDGITDATYKTFKEEGYQQVTDANHYKEIRKQNEEAEAKRQETIRKEDEDRAGMSEEQKEELDAMFRERASLFAAKELIDSTYTGVDRSNAHEEVDAEIKKINRNIDQFMAENHRTIATTNERESENQSNISEPNVQQIEPSVSQPASEQVNNETIETQTAKQKPKKADQRKIAEEIGKMSAIELREYTDKVLADGRKELERMQNDENTSIENIEEMRRNLEHYEKTADEFVAFKKSKETPVDTVKHVEKDAAKGDINVATNVASVVSSAVQKHKTKTDTKRTVVTTPNATALASYGGVMTSKGGAKTPELKRSEIFKKNAKIIFAGGIVGLGAVELGKKVGKLARTTFDKVDLDTPKGATVETKQQGIMLVQSEEQRRILERRDSEYQSRISDLEDQIKSLSAKVKDIQAKSSNRSKNVAEKIKGDHNAKKVEEKISKLDSKVRSVASNTKGQNDDEKSNVITNTTVRVKRTTRPGETAEESRKIMDKVAKEKMAEAKKIAENMQDQIKVTYEKPKKQIKRTEKNAKKIDEFWKESAAPEIIDKQTRPKSKKPTVKRTVNIDVDLDK